MNSTTWIAGALVLLGPLGVSLSPVEGRPAAVIVAPWSDSSRANRVALAADGLLLRPTSVPWMTVAVFERPGFVHRLWHHGAWLTVDAVLAEACLGALSGGSS